MLYENSYWNTDWLISIMLQREISIQTRWNLFRQKTVPEKDWCWNPIFPQFHFSNHLTFGLIHPEETCFQIRKSLTNSRARLLYLCMTACTSIASVESLCIAKLMKFTGIKNDWMDTRSISQFSLFFFLPVYIYFIHTNMVDLI